MKVYYLFINNLQSPWYNKQYFFFFSLAKVKVKCIGHNNIKIKQT